MPKPRGKTPGWAAVDLKLRRGGGVEPDLECDPYPPIQTAIASIRPCRNPTMSHDLSSRPMSSSVLVPPAGVAIPNASKELERTLLTDGRVSSKKLKDVVVDENVQKSSLQNLMERYCIADPSLIEDILLAVDNNLDSAARVLNEMYPYKSFSKQDGTSIRDPDSSMKDDGLGKAISDVERHLNTVLERTQMSSGSFDCLADSSKGFESSEMQFFDDALASIKQSIEQWKDIPSEPEWEDDDVYLSHRKDAIKLMRSAAQHSRMASNAYLKGDHYSAQQHSSRAQVDWLAAKNLHSKAANEILSINNMENNVWKLDLHGLHAAEAVKALQNHLTMIETQSSSHRSISPNRVTGNHILVGSSSSESLSAMIKDVGPSVSSRQRPAALQVITGRGLHSKGHAALPAAVRGYLDENGYRYDDTRPGVIHVRPKFRRGRCVPK